MTLSNWLIFTKIHPSLIHPSAWLWISLLFFFFYPAGLQSSTPAEGAISHESQPDHHPELPLSEPANNQQWEKIRRRTNKEEDKHSSPPFTKQDETPSRGKKIKGCLPPLLLLHHHLLLQARAPLHWGVFVCLKVCVRIVGGSSGPCFCAGDPSWSGWVGWAQWSDATPQTEAPQCRRWTLRKTTTKGGSSPNQLRIFFSSWWQSV